MFFADPIAAFANLGRALRPGGRMVFVCFRARELNGWMTLPMAAAATIVPLEPPPAPGTPGPFSLADKERLHAILDSAGFIDVVCTPFDRDLVLGKDVDEATEFSIAAGPTARLLLDATDEVRTRVRTAVKNALAQYAGASGVALPSAAWIVRATNPLLAA